MWFYLGVAGWKAAVSAVATILVLLLAESLAGAVPREAELVLIFSVLFGGLLLATLMGLVGAWAARTQGVRVFVYAKLFDLCDGDFTLIGERLSGRRSLNPAMFVLMLSIFTPIMLLGAMICILDTIAARGNVQNQGILYGLGIMAFGPIGGLVVYGFLSRRVLAGTPSDCWPEQFVALAQE